RCSMRAARYSRQKPAFAPSKTIRVVAPRPGSRNVYLKSVWYTKRPVMRTNIEIDDELMTEALRASGLTTKRAAVEAGLKALIRLNRQRKILDLAGKVQWEGDLDES